MKKAIKAKPEGEPLIKSWSYSRYSTFKQCPLKAKLKFIDKIEEPKNPHLERGIEAHTKAEQYVKSEIQKMPACLEKFKEVFKDARRAYKKTDLIAIEENWGFTSDWEIADWFDWQNCATRVKVDFLQAENGLGILRDWKTGKFRQDSAADYMEQLELYALATFLQRPDIENLKCYLYYLDSGYIYPEKGLEFTRADLPRLIKLWDRRVAPMLKATKFPPRANKFCNWCHYRKVNAANGGGQCKY